MRFRFSAILFAIFVYSQGSSVNAQTTSPTTTQPQAASLLAQSAAVLTGSTAISDVTLTGNARRIAGSTDETGTVTYRATLTANRLDLFLSDVIITVVRSLGGTSPTGAWIGPDGTSHNIALHNLMTDPGLFPLFALTNINSSPASVITYVGVETRNSASVIHLSTFQLSPISSGPSDTLSQHLTQVDIYLDSTTFLPESYVFNIHPDNNALRDLPSEIRYSDYRNVGGTQIPFHVQQFVNNSLALDLQFQNASSNTGLTAVQITAQ